MFDWLLPQLSPQMQAALRIAYGMLLLGFLTLTWRHRHRLMVSKRWSGYADSDVFENVLQNPRSTSLVFAVWAACACSLIFQHFSIGRRDHQPVAVSVFFHQYALEKSEQRLRGTWIFDLLAGSGSVLTRVDFRHRPDLPLSGGTPFANRFRLNILVLRHLQIDCRVCAK